MTTALMYLLVIAFVAAVIFALAAVVFGRGEEMAPLPHAVSPTSLPAQNVTAEDVRTLTFQQVLRGYKMSEVDWALDRLANEITLLRTRITELEGLSAEHIEEPHEKQANKAHEAAIEDQA